MPVDELIADPIDDLEIPNGADENIGAHEGLGDAAAADKSGVQDTEPVTSLFDPATGALNGRIKSLLSEVAAKQPEMAKFMKKTLYRAGEFDKVFPAGITEAKEVLEKIDEYGGVDGIAEKLEGAQEMFTLADAFAAADPSFVEDLIASFPESFAALAPTYINRFAQVNPEDFSAYFGKLVWNDISKAQIPLMMMRLDDVLGDNAKAREIVGNLQNYFNLWKGLSDKPLTAKSTGRKSVYGTNQKTDQPGGQGTQQKEWTAERDTIAKMVRSNAFKTAIAGRTATSEEKAQIAELYQVRALKGADTQFPGWKQKLEVYARKNDKPGYMRFARRVLETVGAPAMASAIKSTLKSGGQPQNRQQTQNGQRVPAAAEQGFTPVKTEPASHEIDWSRTTKGMISKNQAVLMGGKKVQWR